jgi:hypothetical protein
MKGVQKVLTYSVRRLIVVLACLTIFCLEMPAQSSYGSIVGTITDPSGSSVPATAVTLTNLGTGEKRTVESDANGGYQFVNLLPGEYRVDMEKPGFKHQTRDHVQVAVLVANRIDVAMQVGEVGQTVEVSGQVALLQTESASVGQVVEGRAVLETPLNGRNIMNLIQLTPAVVAHGQSSGQQNSSGYNNYQVSGGMVGQGLTLLDGVALNNGLWNRSSFVPIQETIQEFQVMANNLPAEFGGTMNGVINLASKSGTNEFHGTGYEFLRNKVLNASTFFSNRAGLGKPAFTQNQYGLNGGGPIIRNKTFIYMAWEEFIQRQGTTGTYSVPTPAIRGGDFSNIRTASGASITVYDPATTCGQFSNAACATGQTVLRTPFPGDMIPLTRFDKTATIMEQYWPLPNAVGVPFTNANNFVVNYNAINDRNWENLRADQNVSSKQRIFATFNRYSNILPPLDPYNLNVYFYQTQGSHQGMLADTYTINPTTVVDFRMAYTRIEFTRTPNKFGMDLTSIGWPASYNQQLLITSLPVMTVAGLSPSDGGQGPQTASGSSVQFAGVGELAGGVTKIIGRHTIKIGGSYSWLPTENAGSGTNAFSFTTNFTAANPLSPGSTGSAFASYLLGLGSSGSTKNTLSPYGTQHVGGLYIGDTFQMTRRLTLTLGVRWDYPGYWSDRYNQEAVFMTQATNPVLQTAGLNYPGDAVLVNSDRYKNSTNQVPHWDLFSPRFGVAYRLNDKTVLRSGFGTSYAPGDSMQYVQPATAPINGASTPWVPTANSGLTPVATLNNPFPTGINPAPGRNASYESIILGTSIILPIPQDATPYIMNWNAGFERQLSNTQVIDVSYVATRGVHLRMGGDSAPSDGGPNLNQIPSQYLSLGSQLLTAVANPFYGLVKAGLLAQPTVPYGQLLLPFPQYTGVYSPTTAGFYEDYHSLQAKYQKRFRAGGNLLVAYTWSKNLGNSETVNGHTETLAPGLPQNFNNLSAEKSLISYDVPNLLVVSYVVDLPVGKGRRLLGNVHGVTDKLISGWGVNGVTTLSSGFPLDLQAQPTTLSTNFGAGTPRPNVTAGCNKIPSGSSQARIGEWFNTSCFSAPNSFGFGTEARTDPNIRQAGIANYDFTLFKNTHVTEHYVLQFRAEVFNMFNRVQFGPPGNVLGTAQFGVVSSQINSQRLIQMGLRLSY